MTLSEMPLIRRLTPMTAPKLMASFFPIDIFDISPAGVRLEGEIEREANDCLCGFAFSGEGFELPFLNSGHGGRTEQGVAADRRYLGDITILGDFRFNCYSAGNVHLLCH